MLWNALLLPFQGEIKKIPNNSKDSEPIDEYEILALAKRLNITIDDMKQMSFTSLLNILLSSVDDSSSTSDVRNTTQEDIDRLFR